MELPKNKADPTTLEEYATNLDLESGKEILIPVTKRSDATIRSGGWSRLVRLYG